MSNRLISRTEVCTWLTQVVHSGDPSPVRAECLLADVGICPSKLHCNKQNRSCKVLSLLIYCSWSCSSQVKSFVSNNGESFTEQSIILQNLGNGRRKIKAQNRTIWFFVSLGQKIVDHLALRLLRSTFYGFMPLKPLPKAMPWISNSISVY